MFIGLILRIFAPFIQQWMNAKYGNQNQQGQVGPQQPGQPVQPDLTTQPQQYAQPVIGRRARRRSRLL